jgi:hypothetical protein
MLYCSLIHTFRISKLFLIFLQYIFAIFIKHTTDDITTAGINYKELYNCKWYPMILTHNKLYIGI